MQPRRRHPILVSAPSAAVVRLVPVDAEEDGGRDAEADEQGAHDGGRDDAAAAAGVAVPSVPGFVAADDLVAAVDVALRHEFVGAVVAVGDPVAQPGAVHAGAGHRAPELPPLKRYNIVGIRSVQFLSNTFLVNQ